MTLQHNPYSGLEVLIATQNRTSLDFLSKMFPNSDFKEFKILIVNQTILSKDLISNHKNIKVINSHEKGLSKSRNLALQNASTPIVLISDDDVVYEQGFHNVIRDAFYKNPKADLITFKAKDFKGQPYRNYANTDYQYDLKSIKGVISWEIAFKVDNIKRLQISFDERFGLGSQFTTAEEYIFAREVVEKGHKSFFCNQFIVSHPEVNSGMDLGSDRIIYARSALNYKLHKFLVYFWLPKFIFFLIRNNYIKLSEALGKIKMGLKGIKDYKNSVKS
ncbi:glycosyltransferase family 2 protein [Psychroserpens mesophilus]|uniref:glycosyltransferase family 2 protein n=1 Tax=Psychroserpens mesophilus TaxID=325473 RepID=UPI003D647540